MTAEWVLVGLPIVWAIVATIIALVLYRSSQALFEDEVANEKGRRRVRLVGSIVIAAVVFLGLARATDMSEVQALARGEVRISGGALGEHRAAMTRLRQDFEEVSACAAITQSSQCGSQVATLRASLVATEGSLDALEAPPK